MVERAGRLSERLRFERRDEARGPAGDGSALWQFAFERWGQLELLARADPLPVAADGRHSAGRWRVTVRAGGAEPEVGMRLGWRGGVLKVTGVDADPARKGWLTLFAEASGAAGG